MSATDATTYPHPSGDAVILGPETFADKGKTVICHQGENYYPRPPADDTYVAEDADGTPCLWLLTPGGNGRTELLYSKDDVRATLNAHKPNAHWGAPSRDVYVDRLWDAIAATAGEPTPEQVEAEGEWDPAAKRWKVEPTTRNYPGAEQVEADLAQDEQAHARYYAAGDAIEALVQEFISDETWPPSLQGVKWLYVPDSRLRAFAARVLEVGGQQPGGPVVGK